MHTLVGMHICPLWGLLESKLKHITCSVPEKIDNSCGRKCSFWDLECWRFAPCEFRFPACIHMHTYEIMNVLGKFSVFVDFCVHECILMFSIETLFQKAIANDLPFTCPFQLLKFVHNAVSVLTLILWKSLLAFPCQLAAELMRCSQYCTWRHLLIMETSSLVKLSTTHTFQSFPLVLNRLLASFLTSVKCLEPFKHFSSSITYQHAYLNTKLSILCHTQKY